MKYAICEGYVQCFVASDSFMHHFGRAEYDRNRPVLSESLREQAQPIVDRLNDGSMSHEEAKAMLDKIHW